MRVGFIVPVLNAADHLAGTLAQIEDYGRVVVVEYVDSTVGASESGKGRSLDDTYKIAEAFDGVTFLSMGKVKNRCTALNKGLSTLQDAEFIVVLQYGDFLLDIRYLMDEMQYKDVISTRRFRFWGDFGHYFLGRKEEIAFRNVRGFGDLRYTENPYNVMLSDGHALKDHNVSVMCMDNVLANFRMVTSPEKRKRMYYREQREEKLFSFGDVAARNFRFEDVKMPSVKSIDDGTSFLGLVPHPWKNNGKSFFDKLPTFPAINTDDWRRCFGEEYVEMFIGGSGSAKLRVLGLNCHSLSSQFESEGWEFSAKPYGKFDLIFSVGDIPDINGMSGYLREGGRIIVVDSSDRVDSLEYETMFLKEDKGLFSFALARRDADG